MSIREEIQIKVPRIEDDNERRRLSLIGNQKRQLYVEAAAILVNQIPNHVSHSEYFALAWDAAGTEPSQAARYYEAAARVANTKLQMQTAYRALGGLYFSQSSLQDFDKGRQYYKEALKVVAEVDSGHYATYIQGYIYETWATSEFYNGFRDEGTEKAREVRTIYESLPSTYPPSVDGLKRLDDIERSSIVRTSHEYMNWSDPVG